MFSTETGRAIEAGSIGDVARAVETGSSLKPLPDDKEEMAKREVERLIRWMHLLSKDGVAPRQSEFVAAATTTEWTIVKRCGSYTNLVKWCGLKTAQELRCAQAAAIRYKKRRRPVESYFGAPIKGCAMSNAPTNEQGVVLLFGIMAKELGFEIELVRTAFPDCEAKRYCKDGRWRRVRIEFEFDSRNFNHDAAGCDLVVCWTHNAKKLGLEVLELKTELEKRSAAGMEESATRSAAPCSRHSSPTPTA
ncbi:MAG: hypothetical protein JNM86_06890 [Phycisphaerae bacterium]|nr:hypothetical protein [Phycisphaerae bacterium]